jgi:uncharacterized membrane protein HdeD (DUF308 family)
MYKRLSRKFKVLGVFAGIIGLFFLFSAFSTSAWFFFIGLLFIGLGIYLFVDNPGLASDEQVEAWTKRQQIKYDDTEESGQA